jgi:hypothetical protein
MGKVLGFVAATIVSLIAYDVVQELFYRGLGAQAFATYSTGTARMLLLDVVPRVIVLLVSVPFGIWSRTAGWWPKLAVIMVAVVGPPLVQLFDMLAGCYVFAACI